MQELGTVNFKNRCNFHCNKLFRTDHFFYFRSEASILAILHVKLKFSIATFLSMQEVQPTLKSGVIFIAKNTFGQIPFLSIQSETPILTILHAIKFFRPLGVYNEKKFAMRFPINYIIRKFYLFTHFYNVYHFLNPTFTLKMPKGIQKPSPSFCVPNALTPQKVPQLLKYTTQRAV